MDWNELQKPWRQDQVEQRFVLGTKITLKELAELSGNNSSNVYRWSSEQKWQQKRDDFLKNLIRETAQKAQKKIADDLANERLELIQEHLRNAKMMRDLVKFLVQYKIRQIQNAQAKGNADEVLKEITSSVQNLNYLSLILERTCAMESRAVGLDYFNNLNNACAVLENAGYQVLDPSGDVTDDEPELNFEELELSI